MTVRSLFLVCILIYCPFALAQTAAITKLPEVAISDAYLKKHSTSLNVQKISDSIIQKNKPSLTSLLNYNTLIYFKENGLGMVSSPSFRGTTAQQTAVIWNGININSQLTGQTDFNTISTRNFSSIAVRSGGGSAIYGSSAIGGSIHLNNDLSFKKTISGEVQVDYGSFNTLGAHFKTQVGTDKMVVQIGFSRNSSDNDYTFARTNKKNENGQFYNDDLNVNFGYKLNNRNFIKLYSTFSDSQRHFSPALGGVSKSMYENVDTKNLLEWQFLHRRFSSNFRLAHLQEEYHYFESFESNLFSFGKAATAIAKYDASFKATNTIVVNTIAEYTQTKASGSNLLSEIRKTGSFSILVKQHVSSWFLYELASRKEITNSYQSPILFSIGTVFSPFSFYKIKINGSRNFRIPSFNDLYWKTGGNPNLKPENAYQTEITQELYSKKFSFQLTGFGIKVQDLIQWKPNSSGIWSPENVAKVTTYGFEMLANGKKILGKHVVNAGFSVGYTKSIDEVSKKELIYTPNYKGVVHLKYSYSRFSLNNELLYNGRVFTSSDNQNMLPHYKVFNSGLFYNFGKKQRGTIGLQVANVSNENYQPVLGRFMPERNYTININLNF